MSTRLHPPRALRVCALVSAVATCACVWPARAQTRWVPAGATGGGAWETPGNWSPAVMPDAVDVAVLFTNDISANATITMTAGRTVGSMLIADSAGAATHSWTFQPAAPQVLTLQTSSGSAAIVVSNAVAIGANQSGHKFGDRQTLNLGSDLAIAIAPSASFGVVRAITSAAGKNLTIGGGGQFWVESVNSANTGSITVNGSALRIASNGDLNTAPNTLLFAGNLLLNDAVLLHQNTFSRTVGAGAGQVQFAGTSVGFGGRSAGNGSTSGLATLNLNNDGGDILAGSGSMPPTTFNLNTTVGLAANVPLTVANSLDLNGNTVTINAGPASGFNLGNGVTLAGANGIKGTGNLIVTGGAFLKVLNGLNHTGTTTVNGGNLLTPTVPAGNVVAQNGGVLHTSGLFARTLGTGLGEVNPAAGLGLGAYNGDLVVRLNGGTAPVNASAFASLLTLNGPVATGQVDVQNPIVIDTAALTLSASPGGYACAVPSGCYGSAYSIVAPLSGSGNLIVTGGSGGLVVLNGPSSYAGTTTVDGGSLTVPQHSVALFGCEGKGLSSANLTLKNGGILATSGTFSRNIGTGAGQVQWTTSKRGGFAAVGGELAVQLNSGTGSITFDAANTFGTLVLGSEFSTHTVDFQNDLNTGGSARTITLAGSVEQKISGDISGTGGITIPGGSFGTLVLAGNNSFGALNYASSGDNNTVLKLGSPTALGAVTAFTLYRGVLDLNGYSVSGVNLGVSNNGNPNGQNYLQNSAANEVTWGGNVTASYSTGMFGGRGPLRVTGSVGSSGSAGLGKAGMGRLTLVGTVGSFPANTTVTAAGGDLVLDYAANNANKIPSTGTGSLTLNACALTVLGNASAATTATLPNFIAGTGWNRVAVTNGAGQNATLLLNACSRARGGTVDFAPVTVGGGSAAVTTTTTSLYNGLLRDGATATRSGYATFGGGQTWATVSGGNLAGLAAFDALGTASGNIDLAGDQNVSANITYNTLRFNGGASTLTIDTTRTLTLGAGLGAILMTPAATGKATIASAGTGQLTVNNSNDLVVHQCNTAYELEISARVYPYQNDASLTKSGPGLLYMSNPGNDFDGWVYLNGGTLRADTINAIAGTGSSCVGRGLANRPIAISGGARFLYTGTGHASTRDFNLRGDAVIDASGSGALTLNGQASASGRSIGISSPNGVPYDLTLQGSGAGVVNGLVRLGNVDQAFGGFLAGRLYKKGSGTWTFNGEEAIAQEVVVQEGTFNLGHPRNTLVDNAHVTVNGGTLGLGSNTDKVGVVTLKSGAITGSGTLQGYRYDVESGSIAVALAGVVSSLTKTTGGTVTLSGANSYLGDTLVKAGTLVSPVSLGGDVIVDSGATLQAKGTVGGDLTLDGTLLVDASAPSSLAVGGALQLAGNCVVSGGTGALTITADSVSGTFSSVTAPYRATYSPGGVTIGLAGGTLLILR